MTFTEEEKKKAQDTWIINNYTNNFYSGVSDVEMKTRINTHWSGRIRPLSTSVPTGLLERARPQQKI